MPEINAAGVALLKQWERCVLYAYDDATEQRVNPGSQVHGTLTIGYGHTGNDVVPGLTWSQRKPTQG